MDTARQFEICQEARFVLWALRCAVAGQDGAEAADRELARGFELADVPETTGMFRQFAAALGAVQWPETTWHHPRCCCVSAEEMLVLQALADTALRQRGGGLSVGNLWRLLLPPAAVGPVERAARAWLVALERAGVVFPAPSELMECLRPLESLTEPAAAGRLH